MDSERATSLVKMLRAGGDCNPTTDGHRYLGHTSVTASGKQCQAWASLSPHTHSYNQNGMYPDKTVNDASNYCRNPDSNWDEGLWCYTTDPGTRWERCDVPACRKSMGCIKCILIYSRVEDWALNLQPKLVTDVIFFDF